MTSKLKLISELATQTAQQITSSSQEWISFLTTAARLYKYSFDDQLLIYAQRPDATACASMEQWNGRMHRWIKGGSKGIALIKKGDGIPRLEYVFDITDTHPLEGGRTPKIWKVREDQYASLVKHFIKSYDISEKTNSLTEIAARIVEQNYGDYLQDLMDARDGSFLEELDKLNTGVVFRDILTASVQYILLSRCGLDADSYFEDYDFQGITNFNTLATLSHLGNTANKISKPILLEIGHTIKEIERGKVLEPLAKVRQADYNSSIEFIALKRERRIWDDRINIHEERGLLDSRPDDGPGGAGGQHDSGQIRNATGNLLAGAAERNVYDSASVRGVGEALTGNRSDSTGANRPDNERHAENRPRPGQSNRPNGMGTAYEQPESSSGGSRPERTGLQLSLFPSVEEQIEQIALAEEVKSSAFSIAQTDIDHILLQGSGVAEGKFRIYRQFQGLHSAKENITFLKHEYGTGGGSHTFPDGSNGSHWHDNKGLSFSKNGWSITKPDVLLKWPNVEKHIRYLVLSERYLTSEEQINYNEWNKGLEAARTELSTEKNTQQAMHPTNGQLSFDFSKSEKSPLKSSVSEQFQTTSPHKLYKEYLPLMVSKVINDEVYAVLRDRNIDPNSANHKLSEALDRIVDTMREEHPEFCDAWATLPQFKEWMQEDIFNRVYQDVLIEKRDSATLHVKDPSAPEWVRETKDVTLTQDSTKIAYDGEAKSSENQPDSETGLTPNVPEYQSLKAKYPGHLVAVEKGDYFLLYGKDAKQAERILHSRLFTQEIPELGNTSVTGFLYKQWVSSSHQLWEKGCNVVLADENGPGEPYSIAKVLEAENFIPIGASLEIDGRRFKVESVDFESDKVSLQDLSFQQSAGFPIFRSEPVSFVRSCWEEQWGEKKLEEMTPSAQEKADDNVPDTANLIGIPTYKIGDHATLQYGNEELSGTIGYIGNLDIRIDTGPYSWSNQVMNKEYFDTAIRKDSRNVHLFAPEKINFRITDNDLGAGGQKAKYQNNVQAVRTLKLIEKENRLAIQEEQETLSQYVGWGGLPQAFDPNNETWSKEYSELKELLTADEYTLAQGSVLNAHYTSPTVIKAMYSALERMGFQTGNILEPACGIGNFFGLVPECMKKPKLYGVELDSITGRIAKQLYQKANITIDGFEKTAFPNQFFDLAVGNVPFGNYQIADRQYDKYHFAVHDFFFAKTIDQVRSGGLIAYITSKGTMDKANPEVRKYIASRAELLGAVRLPNNAFKANAGTEVTSDILFLQKRERITDKEPEWVSLGKTPDDIPVNRYFEEHPEMILGTMTYEYRMYGKETACLPIKNANLARQLQDALKNIELPDFHSLDINNQLTEDDMHKLIPADLNVRNYSYTLADGKLYFRENSHMKPVDAPQITSERIRGMMEIRDCTRKLIDMQLNGAGDEPIRLEQGRLNLLYDRFSQEYGLINSNGNKRAFEQDSSYCLLCSLELLDEDGNLERKADMFTKRTINQQKVITNVKTASEALAVSIGERGCVDIGYMASLLGGSDKTETVIHDLQGIIFKNPESGSDLYSGWEPADEYLSGNVREKLSSARAAAEKDPVFAINVTALEKVQPKELGAAEIEVRLGATWIDPKYYNQFVYELFQTPRSLQDRVICVRYSPVNGLWNISGKNSDSGNNALVYVTYGTKRLNAYSIMEDSLNLRDSRVYDYKMDAQGKEHRELNGKETAIAQQRQESISQSFRDWIWKDPKRREILGKQYNTIFNSTRPREYDGQHIRFVGMNPEITLRPHQLNAVAHILYGKNTLLAHCVGAGKTFEMIAAGMESKRLGLAQKSLYVVPNHLTEQWGGDFLRLYPGAKVLVATKKDFQPQNRKKFCARIATGDYDAVIIGHSQFEKIPVSRERQEHTIQGQIFEITLEIKQAKEKNGEKYTIKQMEKTKKSLEARIQKLNDNSRKDDVVTFEELGVDRLFVDEADSFKNLFLYTKMRNVAGIGQTEAQKSSDMFTKCQYMDELTDGRGITFATGTPISNSMTELYTMMRYLQYATLQRQGLKHFDSWAAAFGEKVTAIELAPEGTGFRAKTRFARFFNLPELMSIWKEAADIQTADMLHLPTPTPEYITVVIKPSEHQKEGVLRLADRADDVRKRLVEPYEDNMLKITSDGRKLALDQRLQNSLLPDDPDSKVNTCVKNIMEVWRETTQENGTQLVFCDLSTPHYDGKFNVYDDMKTKLIVQGISTEEIAFIHDAKTEIQKKQLFAKVRKGQVRILFGSTSKMGAGTNVQDRLAALHHPDVPWKPRDIEQREGRAIRQGNRNKTVKIFRYVTEGTFDAYSWALIENKQKFIGQVVTGKSPARSCEDIDETALSYAEVKALATGNPLIKEKMDLDIQVAKLKLLKADHVNQHYQLEDNLLKHFPQQIQRAQEKISALEKDQKHLIENLPHQTDSFSMTVMGKTYVDKKSAGTALVKACKQMIDPDKTFDVGNYRGFSMQISIERFTAIFKVTLKNQFYHTAELGNDPLGNITRINHALESIPTVLAQERDHLETLHQQVKTSKEEVNRLFPQETELKSKMERLNQLNIEMSAETGSNMEQEMDEEQDFEETFDLNM